MLMIYPIFRYMLKRLSFEARGSSLKSGLSTYL